MISDTKQNIRFILGCEENLLNIASGWIWLTGCVRSSELVKSLFSSMIMFELASSVCGCAYVCVSGHASSVFGQV